MGNNKKDKLKKEDEQMSVVLDKIKVDIKVKLNRITAKATTLKTKNGIIELDFKNPQHKEWFEDDGYKGK